MHAHMQRALLADSFMFSRAGPHMLRACPLFPPTFMDACPPAGVAPTAKLVALDVFAVLSGSTDESALWSWLISAVDWSVANKAAYNITLLNMSLGGGVYTSACFPMCEWFGAPAGAFATRPGPAEGPCRAGCHPMGDMSCADTRGPS